MPAFFVSAVNTFSDTIHFKQWHIIDKRKVLVKIQAILGLFVLLSFGVSVETIRLSEPVFANADSETFGALLDESVPESTLAQLFDEPNKYLETPFRLNTTIAKVCRKKGCFFIAQDQELVIRVAFKEYSFFIPTDSHGKSVTLVGHLVQKDMTPQQAEHFESDMGSNKTKLRTGLVYEIVAESIRIPLS